MQHFAALERRARLRSALWLLALAILVALALNVGMKSPPLGLLLLGLIVVTQLPAVLQRARLKRTLRSGDLAAVLKVYHPTLARLPHPETLGPLMVAATLAAHGLVGRAQRAMDHAVRGDAWDAALEHRWFVETLMEAFEGDREGAVAKAQSLERLPLPDMSASLQRRVVALRAALTALARAFARRSSGDDAEVLVAAAEHSPLVHWAMRYGAVVAYLERGEHARAQQLLSGAPSWPADSAFCAFQEELRGLAFAQAGADGSS
jgi:hypothetical protein